MSIKIGRHDDCVCGSGKKYKKCCMTASNVTTVDFEWQNIRQTEGSVVDKHLLHYIFNTLPPEVFKTALEDFLPKTLPEALDEEHFISQFGMSWILFNWIAEDPFDGVDFDASQTIAMNYYQRYQKKLNSRERQFIQAINSTYYSFYSILDVEPGKELTIRDLLLDKTHTIKEKQGTHYLKKGDIVFSRVLEIENQSIFVGMAPMVIPARGHIELIDFKNWLVAENDNHPLTEVSLSREFDCDILDYFFEILDVLYHPKIPTLLNTDGDLLVFSRSQFKLEMPIEEALQKLLPMTLSKNYDEFLNTAQKSQGGQITKIEFPWLKKGNKKHKDWENTVLGQVIIEKNKLILETNSEKRTTKGKKLLLKYLGNTLHFQNTLLETPEQKLNALPENYEPLALIPQDMLPEIQAHMSAMAKNHWERWFDEPIPALDNQSPIQASKSQSGREKLEALLTYYEYVDNQRSDPQQSLKADVQFLRKRLNLHEVVT